jgi:hypothetical protein
MLSAAKHLVFRDSSVALGFLRMTSVTYVNSIEISNDYR